MTDAATVADALRERIDGSVTVGASLAPFTTFRVGGPADVLVEAEAIGDLRAIADVRGDLPVTVVGRGSNMLVSDDGFRGIAIRLGRAFRHHRRLNTSLELGGAVSLPAAARLTARYGLTGFEFAAEIPATFGGAVRMNAGAHGRSMSDVLTDASIVDVGTGDVREVDNAALAYDYRHSALGADDVVVGGRIALDIGDGPEVGERIAGYLRWRRENQPPGFSAGSVFKNPSDDSAGRLIDAAGAKGMRIGGAQISPVHANFIVADKGASAADVMALIVRAAELVKERFGVVLEPEVRFLGTFEPSASRWG